MSLDPASHIYYAHLCKSPDGKPFYTSFHTRRDIVESYGFDEEIVKVKLRKLTAWDVIVNTPFSEYWGWLPAGETEFVLVYPELNQFLVCFEGGLREVEAAAQDGEEKMVCLVVEPVI
jgi:hypothetical protein